MRAVWYDRQGPAAQVLQAGELPAPEPGPGKVRVRLTRSGVNPGDTKKRRGWLGSSMPFPRVIPHSNGAGVIESVGRDADPARIGRRVWVYGAQSYRPSGTAAQLTVVPDRQAVDLPDGVSDDLGACLGIPGITAHRAVFGDGPVNRHRGRRRLAALVCRPGLLRRRRTDHLARLRGCRAGRAALRPADQSRIRRPPGIAAGRDRLDQAAVLRGRTAPMGANQPPLVPGSPRGRTRRRTSRLPGRPGHRKPADERHTRRGRDAPGSRPA